MPDLNHFAITGIISRAATPAATNSGHQYAKFSVEVDRAYALRDGTVKPRKCFFQCTVFGRLTDQAARELLPGVRVALEGEVAEQRTRNQATQEWESLFCLEVQRWVLLSGAPDFKSKYQPDAQLTMTFQPPPPPPVVAPAPATLHPAGPAGEDVPF